MDASKSIRTTDKGELAGVKEWIDTGAPWPEASVISSLKEDSKGQVKVLTSGGLHPSWDERLYPKEKLWAWKPLKASLPPMDHHPVDWFIRFEMFTSLCSTSWGWMMRI